MTRTINSKVTVPLNGWRSRTLAEYFFGDKKYESRFTEGMKIIVPVYILQDLPDFDSGNQAHVDSFKLPYADGKIPNSVIVTFEAEDVGYGWHISLEHLKTFNEMGMAYSWADYLRVEIVAKQIGIFFRDIRPEDLIMKLPEYSIRGAYLYTTEHELSQRWWCENDLVYKIIQLHGDKLQAMLEKACVI